MATAPSQFHVSLPAISLPDCLDAAHLQGDYLLPVAKATGGSRVTWRVSFESVCGYDSMTVRLWYRHGRKWTISLNLRGGPVPVTWVLEDVKNLAKPESLKLVPRQDAIGDWPESVQLRPLAGASPAMAAVASSSAMTSSSQCQCISSQFPTVHALFAGVEQGSNCECLSTPCLQCDRFDELFVLELQAHIDCYWYFEIPGTICPWGAGYQYIAMYMFISDCEVELSVEVDAATTVAVLDLTIPLEKFDPSKTYVLEVDSLGWDDAHDSCRGDAATVEITFIGDDEPFDDSCIALNKWGNCNRSLVTSPGVFGFPDSSILVPCCDCGCTEVCPATDIPGVAYRCTSCRSTSHGPEINEPNGNVAVHLPVASWGAGELSAGMWFNTNPSGLGSANLLIDERVSEDTANAAADVYKCDNSRLHYVCKDGSGKYLSIGGNPNKLQKNENGTFTETQDSGLKYDFDTNGTLFKITKELSPGQAVWTIAHDVNHSHTTDPNGARTTYSYL